MCQIMIRDNLGILGARHGHLGVLNLSDWPGPARPNSNQQPIHQAKYMPYMYSSTYDSEHVYLQYIIQSTSNSNNIIWIMDSRPYIFIWSTTYLQYLPDGPEGAFFLQSGCDHPDWTSSTEVRFFLQTPVWAPNIYVWRFLNFLNGIGFNPLLPLTTDCPSENRVSKAPKRIKILNLFSHCKKLMNWINKKYQDKFIFLEVNETNENALRCYSFLKPYNNSKLESIYDKYHSELKSKFYN